MGAFLFYLPISINEIHLIHKISLIDLYAASEVSV